MRLPQFPQAKLVVIDDPIRINVLTAYLSDKEFIAYDCETTGLTRRDQVIGFSVCASSDEAYYVILKRWNKDKQALEDTGCMSAATALIESLAGKSLIMHNGTFDCFMAESNFKVRLIDSLHTDTMVLAHLLNENNRVGLKELGEAKYGVYAKDEQKRMKESVEANGGSMTKKLYELYKGDAQLIGEYGAKDALLTFDLFHDFVPELYEQEMDKFFYEEESMPLLRGPTYELNTTGLQVDLTAMASLKKQLEAECLQAKAFISSEIAIHIKEKYPGMTKKNTFNIGSSQQLSWLLFGKMELEFSTLTPAGKKICGELGFNRLPYTLTAKRDFIHTCLHSVGQVYEPEAIINGKKKNAKKFKEPWAYIACDKKTLAKLAPKFKWIEVLLEYQRKTKLLKTYIQGISSKTRYGVIQPSFLQHGTTSGRYASRSPNFQNLPRDDKRIKGCIIPRAGRTFVGADYSQLEPRVFAYYSGDDQLLSSFGGTTDFYSVIGMEIYGKIDCTPQKDGSPDAFGIKYKKLRDHAKTIALARVYGALAFQLAKTTGKSEEATQADMDAYDRNFPGVPEMAKRFHELAKTKGYAESLFGRKRRIPDAMKIDRIYGKLDHKDLPYEARGLLNLACNHVIQSTGASIVNRSAIRFHENKKQAGIDCQLVLQVHDSLIVECDEKDAETVALLLEDAMCNTIDLKTIQLEAKPIVGKNLANV